MKNSLIPVAGLIFMLMAQVVPAATLEGVTAPDSVTLGGQPLVLNGMGLREFLWVDVYVGTLYLPSKASTPQAVLAEQGPARVGMHLLHDISHKQFADNWKDDFKANNRKNFDELAERVKQFIGFFPDSKEGDVIIMDYVPGKGTSVSKNGKLQGTVQGADFHTALMRIYVGDHPPTSKLKRGMLGQS